MTSSHGRAKTRVPVMAEGLNMPYSGTTHKQTFTFRNVHRWRASSHARSRARAPARAEGLSMLTLYSSGEKARAGGPRPEPQSGPQGRECLHFKQFPTSCNEWNWKGDSHASAKARASARVEGLNMSSPKLKLLRTR